MKTFARRFAGQIVCCHSDGWCKAGFLSIENHTVLVPLLKECYGELKPITGHGALYYTQEELAREAASHGAHVRSFVLADLRLPDLREAIRWKEISESEFDALTRASD